MTFDSGLHRSRLNFQCVKNERVSSLGKDGPYSGIVGGDFAGSHPLGFKVRHLYMYMRRISSLNRRVQPKEPVSASPPGFQGAMHARIRSSASPPGLGTGAGAGAGDAEAQIQARIASAIAKAEREARDRSAGTESKLLDIYLQVRSC
jgi:hypothetical protein